MEQYIRKTSLVEEIERKIKEYQSTGDDYWFPVIENLKNILSFLNTLEMKEVDLEKELNDYGYHYDYVSLASRKELVDFAKHFFELGLKAQKGEEV